MDKLNNIIFLQQRIKFIIFLKNKKIKLKNDLYLQLNKIISRNYNNFKNNLISNYIYNNNNIKLQELLNKEIDNSLVSLNKFKIEINNCLLKFGTDSIEDILYFLYNKKINNLKINKEIIEFINKYFVPINGYIYDKNNKNNINLEYDFEIISNCKSINFTKIKKPNMSLFEYINGCIIYLKINNDILIIKGYFPQDPLNLLKNNGILYNKNNKLLEKIKFINIDKTFKYGYIEQLSTTDLFILNIDEIIDNIQKDYFKIINYKQNNISFIVKDFLNKNVKEQLEIIVLFLLNKNNEELQYIAYLLYDLINNDSYLLKSQPLSNQIYDNLHWILQKDFKFNFNKIDTKIKNKVFNIDDISYEKQIYLMNCKDNVKQKAYEKYKEISNKSNDNTYKSQQYLDSLLKIPFGKYKTEEIMTMKQDFEIQIKNLVKLIDEYIIDKSLNFKLEKYDNYIYINLQKTIHNINDFYILFVDNTNIKKIVSFYIKNTKNKNIQDLIESINNDNIDIKLKNKSTKKQYINDLNNFFNDNEICNTNKIKYLNKIQNKDKNNKYLYKKIENTINNWEIYIKKKKKYIEDIDNILDNAIYSQDEAKNEVKRIIGQWINGKPNGYCLGFEGPPGIGKTSLAKKGISKCLLDKNGESRPFAFIALGGSSNGSLLEGHNYTYVGSNYGKIIEVLIQTKCMNPIIYIDELDKISNTENGKELIGILTHLTDPSQNEHFNDKYFSGIDFDLSKVLFIFSYNDYTKIDSILLDRIHRIKFNYLKLNEKIHIVQKFIIPEILELVGLDNSFISFTDESIKYIITNYTYEAGIRKLKEKIGEIIRQINLDTILKKNNKSKINININYLEDFFENKPKIDLKKIAKKNAIGLVNGLYATSMGVGGITIIQATKSFNESKLKLVITGQQGDIMKESIECSKTLAWNIIPNIIKNKINDELKKNSFGIHIHCPDTSTPKDGPSAGGAITLAIISLLTNIKVNQTVGLTGEIDLNGNISKIGGLDLKIDGGKYAGLKTILIPNDNKDDYNIIKKKNPSILENINIIFIKNIKDILEICLEKNNLEFNYFQ